MNLKKGCVLALGLTMALSGCASSSNSNEQTLTVGISTELNGVFSPLYYQTTYDGYVIDMIYQKMMRYDENSNLKRELIREDPIVSEDGKTITFKLKKGVKFSDGSKLTSSDVKYTFTLMADPSYDGRFTSSVDYLEGYSDYHDGDATDFSGIETPDDYTVVFHLDKPRVDALSILATTGICSDSQYKYKKGHTKKIELDSSNPIGSGPYQLNNYAKSEATSLTRNPYYKAKKGQYQIDNVVIKMTESSSEISELEKGDIDYIPYVQESDKINTASKNSDLTMNSYPSNSLQYMFFNCKSGPTADQSVRQALTYALDCQAFVDSYFDMKDSKGDAADLKMGYVPATFGNPISASLGDVVRGETIVDGMTYYSYDIEKAKQLLDDAGWTVGDSGYREKDGQILTIKFLACKNKDALDTLIPMMKKSWGDELNVDLKTNEMEFNTVIDTIYDDSAIDTWSASFYGYGFTDVENTSLYGLFHSEGSESDAKISDEQLDVLMDEGLYTSDQQASKGFYLQALIRQNEICGYVPIYGLTYVNLYNKKVKNMSTGSIRSWANALDTSYIKG